MALEAEKLTPVPVGLDPAEAREEYMASGTYTGPLTVINAPKIHTL